MRNNKLAELYKNVLTVIIIRCKIYFVFLFSWFTQTMKIVYNEKPTLLYLHDNNVQGHTI